MFLVEEISQRISADIVPRWKQFAIELGFEFEEVNVLNKSASQLDVQECSEKMLKRWWDTNSNPNVAELITALQGIDQNNLCWSSRERLVATFACTQILSI